MASNYYSVAIRGSLPSLSPCLPQPRLGTYLSVTRLRKVGAALSMCYKTGQPILFVGTGQKYTHLRKLNVNYVIKALFG